MTNQNYSKAVLISIQALWCELIAFGQKTIEVRKTKPDFDGPFKVYIYCTKKFYRKGNGYFQGKYCGKVIGEFTCDKITTAEHGNYKVLPVSQTCIDPLDLLDYANGKTIYGWHISNLIIYDKPKELSEFYRVCEKPECDDCPYLHFENTPNSYEGWCMVDEKIPLKRPPQSWCYVENLKINSNNTKTKDVELCTFPDDDKDYCKVFSVPEKWLIDTLETVDSFNERKGVDLENFLDNYVWDETWFIYLQAKNQNKLIWEMEQE